MDEDRPKFNSIEEIAQYLEKQYKDAYGQDIIVDREFLEFYFRMYEKGEN